MQGNRTEAIKSLAGGTCNPRLAQAAKWPGSPVVIACTHMAATASISPRPYRQGFDPGAHRTEVEEWGGSSQKNRGRGLLESGFNVNQGKR
jgi:hypothetical protein